MAIIQQFSPFRAIFAVHASFAPTAPDPLQFTAPNILNRTSGGNWATSGFQVGHRIQPVGTVSNDQYFTIASFASSSVLNTVESNVTTEGPFTAGVTVDGVFIDPGGCERWPVANVRQATFSGGVSGMTVPFVPTVKTVGLALTVNATTADTTPGVDDYDWFLSQRTEDTTKQYISIFEEPAAGGNTFSGTIRFAHTTLAETEFGIAVGSSLTPIQTVRFFNKMDLYVQRKSDKLIQWVRLLALQTANA